MLRKYINSIGSFFAVILGRISWACPPWLIYLRQKRTTHPRLVHAAFISFILLMILGGYGYYWFKNKPRPHLVTAVITQPRITPVAKILVPDNLTINFGINNGSFVSQSVSRLSDIGKEVTDEITMKPTMPGKWVWQTDKQLIFTPNEDWPAGQTYSIQFAKKLFAPHIQMESLSYSFNTLPFQTKIDDFRFYQDPVNPEIHYAVATVSFNYPVDTKSFENHTSLMLEALKNEKQNLSARQFKLTFTYDDNKRVAYIHSEMIPLTDTARYLTLRIDSGVKAAKGSDQTENALSKAVLLPDIASYFKIKQVNTAIVRNEQDRPEQVITIETTLGVTNNELNKALHVYLLPKDYPASPVQVAQENYQWVNPGDVTENILKLATPISLESIPSDRDYATLHSYKISTEQGRYLYIKLDRGIQSFGSFILANNYEAISKVPDYPKEIGFLHQGALLALNSEKKLSVVVRGVPSVKFQIARVLPDDVNQLITQTGGRFNDPRFINPSFNQNNISEIFSEFQSFNSDPAKAQYTALDIGKYLNTKTNLKGPLGLFLLQATGWDKEKNIPLDIKSSRLILITNLGLIVKDNGDGSHDVFVESITTGDPVPNVNVSILGKNGLSILERTTDAEGRAHFPTLKDFTDDREPTVYLARLQNDVSFIPYNNSDRQLNFSKFDIGGIYHNEELQTLSAYVFSDRGIYRPGDTAHIGMIIKQAYAKSEPSGLPLELTVTDPKGTTILDKKLTLDATGFLTVDIPTRETSPTGQYYVNLFIVKDNHPDNLLGSTTIHVNDFQPDRLRITSQFSSIVIKGWVSPKDLSATIGLWNLYGAPAADRKVTAKIVLTPKRIQFNQFPQYIFIDPLFDPNKPPKIFTDTLADAKTNEKGEAQFDLNLERFDKATYQLTFDAEGFESEGGRSVATESEILVSPLSYFVGYKPDGDLNFIKQNSQRSVHFIAINPDLNQQSIENLKIQLIALHPVTTLVKNPDGTFQYQSLIQSTLVNEKPFSINASGTNEVLATNQIGDFLIVVLDQNNTELSHFNYTVVGNSQSPLLKNAELNVKLNKTEYKAGDDIELEITAPYTGSGLITIERDKIYATQWFKTNTTHSIQKIHIPNDFQGNGYVNVTFARDFNSPDIFVSPLSFNVQPFSVSHENQAIKIDLSTPDIARPGEPYPIQYKTNIPSKIVVFLVDEGILQVANYGTPDPLKFFFQKNALEVITQQTIDQILPKFIQERELSAVGGDSGEEALRSHLNPFKRKTDLPVVFWSGIVDADNTPRQLTYQIPDYFNGTLRVMAVAVAADAVGSAAKKSEVRGNFVINPNVPTFVAPGDEFEITASIANNVKGSGKNASVAVQLATTTGLEIIGNSNQNLLIDEGHEKTVRYKIRAKDLLGSEEINFVTSLGDKSSRMHATLSVRPVNNYYTNIISGASESESKSLSIDRSLYPEYREVTAAISNNPLILLSGLQRYLDKFPYGCTEQLVSQGFPLVVSANKSWVTSDTLTVNKKIETIVQMLTERQMSSGAFSYWPNMGENDSNAFASVYVMHFLTESRELGFNIPIAVIHAGINYLKDLAAQNVSSLEEARIQAYAIYVLTRNEIVTTNYLTHLQLYLDKNYQNSWKQDITGVYLAATYQLLKNQDEANRLIKYYKTNANATETTDFYDTHIGDAQYLYLLAKHFPERIQSSQKELILSLINAANSDEINTLFSSYTSLALNAYAQIFPISNNQPFSISQIFANNEEKKTVSSESNYFKLNIDQRAKSIVFHNPSKQMFFYQLMQSGFDKNTLTAALKNHLEIDREYRDLQNNNITKTSLGNEIEVHVQIRALDNRYLSNIAIVDLLPGGFELVRDSVKLDNVDYADLRDDRVIFFTSVSPDAKEIVYRIKAINTGTFNIPPIFANSMYDPSVNAHSISGKIQITEN